MKIGINNNLSISCSKCKSGESLSFVMQRNSPVSLHEINQCRSCGNSFSYLDGIIDAYCSEHPFIALDFVSNIIEYGTCDIAIGTPKVVSLKQTVPIFHKVFLTNKEKFYFSAPIYENDRANFTILSSEEIRISRETTNEDSFGKFGDIVKIGWMVYGRTKELNVEPWKQLLVQSKEEYINEKYLLSFLSVAIALESYINSKIVENLNSKNIDEKSIDIFLKESNMVDKAFVLFKSLIGIDPVEVGNLSRSNFTKIIEKRNKIAHGKIVTVEKNEVIDVFNAVIKFIIYMENS
ncbi:HEPN domain-containing protein [Flavobacterium sp. DG2-3]|uniref:HEPN domain-containing protein n=1 Tax=Flavobacterium sp. DG2-3 TaxID=3068317 RepID=UPI00273D26D6|nr:HEPN domain-containing protein [Flavobacterium sp. DG2-3]MDP5200380.1 hypothetical protein [Flavobacterium sp. DG2-3]